MQSYPRLTIRKERERALINRHPWLFSGAIQKTEGKPREGDIVQVCDATGHVYALGFYQGDSRSLAVRLFHFGDGDVAIDDAFWTQRFENALSFRTSLGLLSPRSGYRLLFSEGDFVPGITVDIFDKTAVLQAGAAGVDRLVPLLQKFLTSRLGIEHIYDGNWLIGNSPEVTFVENGITLSAHVETGQKTGYFFDQRDNRELVAHYSRGKTVLDAFCYSGGFSCHALKGGAARVTSVDVSADAVERCRANVNANFPDANHQAVGDDCFDYLHEMEVDTYDLIVLDPPAFAKSAQSVDRAARGYKDINLVALNKIAKGGLLFTFSCSQHISHDLFRKIVFGAAKDAGRNVRVIHQMTQAPDHPVDICHPEGEYLKGLVLQVED